MPIEAFLVWLVIGAIAGFLAGTVVKGYGFGLVGNIVVGIIGVVVDLIIDSAGNGQSASSSSQKQKLRFTS